MVLKEPLKKQKISDLILVLSDNEDFNYPEFKSNAKKILYIQNQIEEIISNKNVHNISVKKNIGIDNLIKNNC